MAEVSTLTPSPPAMAEQPVSSLSVPPESPKTAPVPKSALYGDRAVMGNPMLSPGLRDTPISLSSAVEVSPAPAQNSAPSSLAEIPGATEKETLDGSSGPLEHHRIEQEPQGTTEEQQMPSSPGRNPSPNLHPDVQVNNPTSASDPPPHYPPPPAPTASQNPENPAVSAPPLEGDKAPSDSPKINPPDLNPNLKPSVPDPPFSPSKTETPSLIVHDWAPSLVPPAGHARPAPDTLSYLESASLMSGTLESLSGLGEDGSSVGSDSEINGQVFRRTDKYGFLGGAQYTDGRWVELK